LSFIPKVSYLFPPRERWQLLGIFLLILGSAVIETLGVGIIVPFIYLLASPEMIQEHHIIAPISEALGIQTQNEFILWASAGMIAIFVAKNVYLVVLTYIQSRFVSNKYATLAHRLFERYLQSPYPFHLQRNSAQLMRNITGEVYQLCQNIVLPTLNIITDITVTIFVVFLVVLIDPLSFVMATCLLGGSTLLFYRAFRRRISRLGKERQHFAGQQIQWVNQGLGGVKEVKVLGREWFFADSFRHYNAAFAHNRHIQQTIQAVPRPFNEMVMVTGFLLIVIITIGRGLEVQSVLPTLSLFAAAGYRLMPIISRIATSMTTIRGALPSLDVVYQDLVTLEQPASHHIQPQGRSVSEPTKETEMAVRLNEVSYRYPNASTYALQGVSLGIHKDQSVGIVGPSGAGKTTLVDVILGLLPPTHGEVLAYGTNIHHDLGQWQHSIGYIPQSIYLCDDTIRANVAFGLPDDLTDDEQVWAVLELAQLKQFVESLPDGLNTVVGERGIRLSGGQKQRIGIARALYHNPEILVMDEATAALDNETERAFVQAVDHLSGQKTIIMIAHRLSTVRRCDRLYFIKEGKVVGDGTYDELLQESGEFRTMAMAA
jgi:ATP-binding cassette, subfamily B, bacterial PglK